MTCGFHNSGDTGLMTCGFHNSGDTGLMTCGFHNIGLMFYPRMHQTPRDTR